MFLKIAAIVLVAGGGAMVVGLGSKISEPKKEVQTNGTSSGAGT